MPVSDGLRPCRDGSCRMPRGAGRQKSAGGGAFQVLVGGPAGDRWRGGARKPPGAAFDLASRHGPQRVGDGRQAQGGRLERFPVLPADGPQGRRYRMAGTRKPPRAVSDIACRWPEGCPPWMAGTRKPPGAVSDIACRWPEGCPPWMAGTRKPPGAVSDIACRWPEGCPPWMADTKNPAGAGLFASGAGRLPVIAPIRRP